MLVWVMYDITLPKRLNKMAKACLRAGLYRVQKSVYLGKLNANQLDELRLNLLDLMDEDTDSVYIFPMNRNNFDRANLLGKSFDKALVTDELKALIL